MTYASVCTVLFSLEQDPHTAAARNAASPHCDDKLPSDNGENGGSGIATTVVTVNVYLAAVATAASADTAQPGSVWFRVHPHRVHCARSH